MVVRYCIDSRTGEFGEFVDGCGTDPLFVLAFDYEQLELELGRWDSSLSAANEQIDQLVIEKKGLTAQLVRVKNELIALASAVKDVV